MRRFYWLKLKDDFFTQKAIKKLRKIAGGDTFTIIYLKMMLIAMKSDGKLYHEGIENNFHEELALELDEDEENVNLTITYLINHGLMQASENEYFIPESVKNTGSESDSAERVRRFRALHGNVSVTQSNAIETLGNVEKEIEKEKKKEKRNKNIDKENIQEAKEIIEYLNLKNGSRYQLAGTSLKMVESVLKQGYTKEDCLKVIDKKYDEWHGTEMEQYLRPLTLFGNKFDTYLNQPMVKKQSNYEKTSSRLTELFNQYGGEENEQTGNSKNIFDI